MIDINDPLCCIGLIVLGLALVATGSFIAAGHIPRKCTYKNHDLYVDMECPACRK